MARVSRYWLMKSEPQVYSIDDLARDRRTAWDGVRNFEARNNLRSMRRGDRALFYHSNCEPSAIVGIMEVVGEAAPDPTQFDPGGPGHDPSSGRESPRWWQVEVRFVSRLARPLTLDDVRGVSALKGMSLLKRGRLSVQPVSPAEWKAVLKAAGMAAGT